MASEQMCLWWKEPEPANPFHVTDKLKRGRRGAWIVLQQRAERDPLLLKGPGVGPRVPLKTRFSLRCLCPQIRLFGAELCSLPASHSCPGLSQTPSPLHPDCGSLVLSESGLTRSYLTWAVG